MKKDVEAPTRRRLGPTERHAELVAAGLALVKEGSLDRLTAPDVARVAGVSKALVFHYFPTQRDLHAAVAQAGADELIVEFDRLDPTLPYGERLAAGLLGFITYIEQQPASYAVLSLSSGSDPQLRAIFETTRERVVRIICEAIGVADPSPRLRLMLRGWIAMVEETTLHWLDERPIDREELVDLLTNAAFGLLSLAADDAPGTQRRTRTAAPRRPVASATGMRPLSGGRSDKTLSHEPSGRSM